MEVTAGDGDYTGPDALVAKYRGEGVTYQGQVLALEAALDIARQWQRDAHAASIYVEVGDNGGGQADLSGGVLSSDLAGTNSLAEEGEAFDATLEKCESCSGILPRKRDRFKNDNVEEYVYCSERCAEIAYEELE